jgi:hypothetical protein
MTLVRSSQLQPPRSASRDFFSDRWLWASLAALALLAGFIVGSFSDVGLTWDEPSEFSYGQNVWAWYRSGFSDVRATQGLQSRYGGLFDLFAELLVRASPLGACETKHLLTALVGLTGVVATWKIAQRLGGSRAGFIAATLLALTPSWFGHALFNPKDIPFGAAAAWSLYATLLVLPRGPVSSPLTWRTALLIGVTTGLALGVRPAGMFILVYPPLALLARCFMSAPVAGESVASKLQLLWRSTPRLLAGTALAWAGMVSAWPWSQHAPISRPLRAAQLAAHFTWHGPMLFRGAWVQSNALPRSYLLTWFSVTLPEAYFLALLCGVVLCMLALSASPEQRLDRMQRLGLLGLVLAAFLPPIAAALTRSVLYDGHRHFLFVLPPLAALCGCLLSRFLDQARVPSLLRAAVAVLLVALSCLTAADMLALHPYEYVYFNRLSGGLRAEAGNFETDYWGATYKEGLAWVVQHVRGDTGTRTRVRVAVCNDTEELPYFLTHLAAASGSFEAVTRSEDADVFLATTRFNCHKLAGRVLHVVERQGVPLLYVVAPDHAQQAAPASQHQAALSIQP